MAAEEPTEYQIGDHVWVNLRGDWSGSAVRTMALPADPDWRAAIVADVLPGERYRVRTTASTYEVPSARLRIRHPEDDANAER